MKLREPIYVIGEGLTEKCYFERLKRLKSYSCKIEPRFFNKKNSIYHIKKRTKELLEADIIVICAFDTDVARQDKKKEKAIKEFIEKYKNNERVVICDSLPSIEFWFLLHFKMTTKHFSNYKAIRNELVKYLPKYNKDKRFLENDKWVKILIEKQETAIKNAKSITSKNSSYSNIYKAIELLEKIIS